MGFPGLGGSYLTLCYRYFMQLKRRTSESLKKLPVGIIYLIGSQARREQDEASDFNVGVVFAGSPHPARRAEIHPILYNLLTDEFPLTTKRDLDIVYFQEASLPFQVEDIFIGQVLHESNPEFRADYEEQVIKAYLDFAPLERIFSEGLMERLS